MRASDSEREATVDALKRHSAAGRITADELEDRSGRAYAASTVGELAALTLDLPAVARTRGRGATSRSRAWPGLARFDVELDVERPPAEVLRALQSKLVPALQEYGYELTGHSDSWLLLKLEERSMWNIVIGLVLFPVGGFLLWLDKGRSQVSITLEEPTPGHTRLSVHGKAPLGVRRRFEGLRL